jgi:hypothetical protein
MGWAVALEPRVCTWLCPSPSDSHERQGGRTARTDKSLTLPHRLCDSSQSLYPSGPVSSISSEEGQFLYALSLGQVIPLDNLSSVPEVSRVWGWGRSGVPIFPC